MFWLSKCDHSKVSCRDQKEAISTSTETNVAQDFYRSTDMDNLNLRCAGVRRLMKEAKELSDPSELFYAQPLEDNLFEWHFTVRGPPDTPFEGGVYHGRIVLPTEYPMKPPNLILLTPNGRFQTNTKICLSISGYHPETWLPSWSIRTALLALIGFFPTQSAGALGGIDCSEEERKRLAVKSQEWKCDTCKCTMKEILKPLSDVSGSSTISEDLKLASEYAKSQNTNGEAQNSNNIESETTPTNELPQPPAVETTSNPEISKPTTTKQTSSSETPLNSPPPLSIKPHPSVAELRARLNRIAASTPVIQDEPPAGQAFETAHISSNRVHERVQTMGDTANEHSNFWSLFWMVVMTAIFLGLFFRRITLSKDVQ